MKVLIVSHTCISRTNNMGKTLFSYFRGFAAEELAQFYIHGQEPTENALCRNYFRFTDMDALKSLVSRRSLGTVHSARTESEESSQNEKKPGWLPGLYRLGEKRTAAGMALRELLWKCSRWNTPRLWAWAEAFAPDVIFLAAGDYGFSYEIALQMACHLGKPLAVCCVDDFYLYNRNADSCLGRLVHRAFLKTVHKTMNRAAAIFAICPSLCREYEALFRKPCHLLHTPALQETKEGSRSSGISYLGNLELGRPQQLVALGRALQGLNLPGLPRYLDVYSGERDPKILQAMTEKNGIRFHGAVAPETVLEIMGNSLAVVHTESFAPQMQRIVRHSVSAKIPDALMNGGCILAYGPEGVASMDYLKAHGAAYCITAPEDLIPGLTELLCDGELREQIVKRARKLAGQNHGIYAGSELLRRILEECHYESHSN